MRVLREQGALSRGQIATQVGLSRTTLSEITGDLLVRGAIVVVDTDASNRTRSGRPAELLALDPSAGQFMGVDFGHTRVRIVVADASHEVIGTGHATYSADSDWSDRLMVAFDLVDRFSTESKITFSALQGVGIGVVGPHAAWGPGRPGTGNARNIVRESFSARFGTPVLVDNNTRFAALAEGMTDGPEVRDLMYVRLSDGIGGGLVVGGRLVSGGFGVAGEIGHVTVQPEGDLCRCGKHGCLETVASLPAVLRACVRRGLEVGTAEDLTAALARREPAAVVVLDTATAAVGQVMAAAALVLNPAHIVVGGNLARCAPHLVAGVETIVLDQLRSVGGDRPVVRAARLDDDDGALGAIYALFQQSPLLAGYSDISYSDRLGAPDRKPR